MAGWTMFVESENSHIESCQNCLNLEWRVWKNVLKENSALIDKITVPKLKFSTGFTF